VGFSRHSIVKLTSRFQSQPLVFAPSHFPSSHFKFSYVGQTSNGVQSLVSQLTVLENPPPNHGLSEIPDKTYRKLYLG
jgi:hypothetical protein